MKRQEETPMEIVFYRKSNGREPINESLNELPADLFANVLHDIDMLRQYTYHLREPYAKHLKGPLWELRTKFSTNIYRIIYYIKDGKIVLLHGFVKKTEQTPPREIEIARRRYKDWEART